MSNEPHEPDLFRDTPIRYLGYSNEIGEAFRPFIPVKVVWCSYGLSSAYVLCDVVHKSVTAYNTVPVEGLKENKTENKDLPTTSRTKNALKTAVDTLIWQSLASVIIPGITINRISAATRLGTTKVLRLSTTASKSVAVIVGLAAIPIIIKPIDHAVDFLMQHK